jgi:hypothetical protein
VAEYEETFPALRLVKNALYDTMLLSFRWPPRLNCSNAHLPPFFCTMQHPCRSHTAFPRFCLTGAHWHMSFTLIFLLFLQACVRRRKRLRTPRAVRCSHVGCAACSLQVRVTRAAGTPQRTRSCAWRSLSWPILPLKTFCNHAFLQEFAVAAAMRAAAGINRASAKKW